MYFWDQHKTITSYYELLSSEVCDRYELTQMEYDILMFLHNNPQHNTAADIVKIRKSTKSHVSTSLKSLENKGLIERIQSEDNKKHISIVLLEKAEFIVQEGIYAQKQFAHNVLRTKRFVRCFWGLDKNLAYARHFPAIQWLTSYSEYLTDLSSWYSEHVDKNFVNYRNQLVTILNQESSLMEIVKLIGSDVLPDDQKLVLEIAKVIRLGFLQQNAFHKEDTCVPLKKQFKMMEIILYLYKKSRALVAMGMPVSVLKEEKIFEKIIAIKYDVPNDRLDMFDDYKKQIDDFYNSVIERNA